MSTVPAVPDDGVIVGLEDFDQAKDAVIPRIGINHKEAVWEDAQSGQKWAEMEVVLLGLVKQRVLWEAEVPEGSSEGPMCRSYNFTIGIPDQKRFPWDDQKVAAIIQQGTEEISCETCPLQEWGSHPTRDVSWCSEQHTYVVMRPLGGGFAPALLTVQRSAIKPSKAYISAFAGAGEPLYTVRTTLQLEGRKRGAVDFAVPKFIRGDETDKADWPAFAKQYLSIRSFVQTPWRRDDKAEASEGTNNVPVEAAAARAASEPMPDDELPF